MRDRLLGIDIEQSLIQPRVSGAEVLYSAEAFPGAFIGSGSRDAFLSATAATIKANPEKTHLVLVRGLPCSGKSTIAQQLVYDQLSTGNQESVGAFAKLNKLNVAVASAPWGDAFHRLRYGVKGRDYHATRHLRDQKQKELEEANRVYTNGVRASLDRKAEDTVQITVCGLPPMTGVVVDNETIGFPRAEKFVQDVVQRTGAFADVADYYRVHMLGVVASPDVREKAKADRSALLHAKTSAERAKIIQRRGISLRGDNHAIRLYTEEVAPLTDVALIEQEVRDASRVLFDRGYFGRGADSFYAFPGDEDPHGQTRFLGQVSMPWSFKYSGITEATVPNSIILYNEEVLPTVTLHPDILQEHIIRR